MKRLMGLMLCVMLLITSCGSPKNTEAPRTEDETVVLNWVIYGERSQNSDTVVTRFNRLLKEKLPGTRVEFEFIPLDIYKERWDRKMATNEVVDLAWIGNDVFNYTEEVKRGSFMAIDYLLSVYGEDLVATIPDNIWDLQRRDDKIYSVPLLGALYRKDYALITSTGNIEQFGDLAKIGEVNRNAEYTNEACYTVFEEYLAALKEGHKLGTGISYQTFAKLADKGYEGIYGANSPFVIKIFDDEPTIYNKYELEEYRTYFKTMAKWYQKGYIRQDIEEILDPRQYDGKLAGSALYLSEYGEKGAVAPRIRAEYDATNESLQAYKYISYEASRNATAIPRTAENPQRAIELVNLLNSEEGVELYLLLVNGLEGRHYVLTENMLIDKVRNAAGEELYEVSPYTVGNVFQNYETEKGQFEQLEKYNEEAIISPLMGFELDTRMIVLEMKEIDLVVRKYIGELEMGTASDWESVYQEFIAKMQLAGSGKIVAEMQRQINDFIELKDEIEEN